MKNKINFPKDFLWGASTSAFQVEGGWDSDGKGKTIMDITKHDESFADFTVASDFYNRYKEDIALMKELGLKSYRFSISWARIFPSGDGLVNKKGIEFYNNVINELVKNNITPIVTIFHFDLPLDLVERGGWENRDLILPAFENYSKTLFESFGDRVKYWLTINEQNIATMVNMIRGMFSAGVPMSPQNAYNQSHTMFMANAMAINLYHEKFKGQNGKIGPAPNIAPAYALTTEPKDQIAALNANVMRNWLYLDMYVSGEYNVIAKDFFLKNGIELNAYETDWEILKKAKPDFIAFNYYSTMTVQWTEESKFNPNVQMDQQTGFDVPGMFKSIKNPCLKANEYGWEIDPTGLRLALREVYTRYKLPIMITENGIGAKETLNEKNTVDDDYRIDYYTKHLLELKGAIDEGVEVISYNPWTAIDLVSSHQGFQKRYGFIFVDREEKDLKQLKRFKKKSFYWYQKFIRENS